MPRGFSVLTYLLTVPLTDLLFNNRMCLVRHLLSYG